MNNLKSISQIFIAFLILVFFTGTVLSQNVYSLGFKAGLVNNHFRYGSGRFSNVTEYKKGAAIGITAELFKSRNFMLMPEVSFLQRGSTDFPGDYRNLHGETSTFFVSFAVFPAYRFETKSVSPFIYAGPRLEAKTSYDIGNNFNWGLSAGIGAEIKTSSSVAFTAEFRYSSDATSFRKPTGLSGTLENFYNSSLDFLVGAQVSLDCTNP
jgi:opacity protein-like surface antigen